MADLQLTPIRQKRVGRVFIQLQEECAVLKFIDRSVFTTN